MSLLKLPGLVDVHVHLREPGGTQKEDFETGSKAAIAGGYTQILDMPNNIPPTVNLEVLEEKEKLAKGRIWCDVGFNFGATADSVTYFPKIINKVFGLKVYMNQTTGPLFVENSSDRELVFKSWTSPLPIMVHAMKETVERAINLAKKYNKSIHVCHVTTDQMESIIGAKRDGLAITCEVCPHHLFLNKDDIERLGPLGMMQPPLMSKHDQVKMWDYLNNIDMISSDHAPHTLQEKHDQSRPKFGVPGLETTLPQMLNAVYDGRLSLGRLKELLHTNPRKIFRLPNQPNTYVFVDASKTYQISSKRLFTKCGWTPFGNFEGRGEIKKVVIRGMAVFENGKFIGKPQGKVISPAI